MENKFTKFEKDEKALVMEQALKPDRGNGKVLKFIRLRKWESLNDFPTQGIMSLVREFYANASVSRENDQVFIWGKKVSFSSEAINTYYGLFSIDEDEDLYNAFWRDEHNYTITVKELCVPNIQWLKGRGKSNKSLTFLKITLKFYAHCPPQ